MYEAGTFSLERQVVVDIFSKVKSFNQHKLNLISLHYIGAEAQISEEDKSKTGQMK